MTNRAQHVAFAGRSNVTITSAKGLIAVMLMLTSTVFAQTATQRPATKSSPPQPVPASKPPAVPPLVEYPSKYDPEGAGYRCPACARLMIKVPTATFGMSDTGGQRLVGGVCVVEKIGAPLDSAGVGWLDSEGKMLTDGTTLVALAGISVPDDVSPSSTMMRFLEPFDKTTHLRVRCAPATRLNERVAAIQKEPRQDARSSAGKMFVAMSEYLAQVVDRPQLVVKVRVTKDTTDAFEDRRTIEFDTQETGNGQIVCRVSVGSQVDYRYGTFNGELRDKQTAPFSFTVPSTFKEVPRIQCGFVQLYPALNQATEDEWRASLAHAQAGVFDMSTPGLTLPRLIRDVKPSYTREAMSQKVQGTVGLEAVVQADGSVSDIVVLRSLDTVYGLDEEAIKTARQWKFAPGTLMGRNVPVRITIELAFTLR